MSEKRDPERETAVEGANAATAGVLKSRGISERGGVDQAVINQRMCPLVLGERIVPIGLTTYSVVTLIRSGHSK